MCTFSTTEEGNPASAQYQPNFPEPYEDLVSFYRAAMAARVPGEIELAIQNLHVFTETLRMLRVAGIFPEIFLRGFREDIEAARLEVGRGVDKAALRHDQQSLYFMMSNFENAFKSK